MSVHQSIINISFTEKEKKKERKKQQQQKKKHLFKHSIIAFQFFQKENWGEKGLVHLPSCSLMGLVFSMLWTFG